MLLWGLGCFHDLSLLQIWLIEVGVGGPWQCFIACLALLQVACRRKFRGWEIPFLFLGPALISGAYFQGGYAKFEHVQINKAPGSLLCKPLVFGHVQKRRPNNARLPSVPGNFSIGRKACCQLVLPEAGSGMVS